METQTPPGRQGQAGSRGPEASLPGWGAGKEQVPSPSWLHRPGSLGGGALSPLTGTNLSGLRAGLGRAGRWHL